MRTHFATRLLCIVLVANLDPTRLASAQDVAPAPAATTQSSKTPQPSISPLVPPRPSRNAKRQRPIDDYVPCLLDDGEIYQKRTLDVPAEPAEPKPDVPLDYETANVVAQRVKHYLLSNVPPSQQGKNTKQNVTAQKDAQEKLNTAQTQIDNLINPELFVGHKLPEVPELVNKRIAELSGLPADVSAAVAKAASNSGAVLTAATPQSAASIAPPDDVVCSFSVMQWQETSDNFGRRVANQYVAIQVTVRNLNQQNEFLLHDIQIAVDTGLNRAQFGRFEAARDKLVVRNVAQRGQTEDRRNVIINVLQAVGAIAGGASTAVTEGLSGSSEAQDMAAAVAIFQGPFITGVINIFPDHTVENINHINDLTFSASSTSKTIVPIQGSIPLVTFLSEKPLEQLPFSRCGTSPSRKFGDRSADRSDPGASLYQFCTLDTYDQYGYPTNPPEADNTFQPTYYRRPYPFRHWKPAALDVLNRRIFVVVGGVHIKAVAKQPTLTSISCLPGSDPTLDLSKSTGPNANCTLKGTDLDLVSQVSLQNATDSNDKSQVQGTSSVSGDTTQAAVTFLKDELLKLKGSSYKLYYSLQGGAPQSTSLLLTLKPLISLSPSSIDFGTQPQRTPTAPAQAITLTNNGSTALNITSVTVTGANSADYSITANTCTSPVAAGKNCAINVIFTPGAAGTRSASLSVTDDALGSPQAAELTGIGK
jgi:hypothetical protein